MGSHKQPGRQSAPADDRRQWTQPKLDYILNAVLQINDPKEFVRACYQLSVAEDRGIDTEHSPMSGAEPVKMMIWKLATRYFASDYQPHPCRINRRGMLFTWVENDMLQDAFDPTKDAASRKPPPTVQYMARLLYCNEYEIRNWCKGTVWYSGGLIRRPIPEE